MVFCKPCAERGRPRVPAAREVGGTPMCSTCVGGGREEQPAPKFERVPAQIYVQDWDRFFTELRSLPVNEDLAAHPRPGESPNALREVIRRKAKARGIEVRFRVVEGVVRAKAIRMERTYRLNES